MTSTGTSNISLMNLNLIMMILNLIILFMNIIGYLQTRGRFMKFVIYHSSTATEPRNTSNQKLISFRKGIQREKTSYPTLKDERYFDSFSKVSYITAKSHDCDDVLDPDYKPSNSEKEFFEAKQIFMFSVLDKHLLTEHGQDHCKKICAYS